ncbi:AfsR/SARP family transcriptional regulator [Micromonospora lupini]|uniref:OmpR/PhoB-type domain-containing protein n=1 Tax=Micromonospora lupini str. Lupac 08 TaxID=1150864 RepID=I0L7D9_9ACTN|nr:winged helix-turn-helix domain-containing protein [Micromonospora lupini]CCH19736.1 Protein of unknown function (probable related with response regulator system) [Micromonospora lupini str. Lupac 08]
MTDFRLLGALDVTVDGVRVPVRAPKQRALLVTLLLRANDEVPMDELYWRLWDQRPPAAPAAALHVHVARLRAVLGDRSGTAGREGRPRVRSLGGGYLLQTPPETVDLFRFRNAAQEPCGPGSPAIRQANSDTYGQPWESGATTRPRGRRSPRSPSFPPSPPKPVRHCSRNGCG